MRSRTTRRVQTLLLVALLATSGIALPSHTHRELDDALVLSDGHHGHGVQLVEQSPRVISPTDAVLPAPLPSLAVGLAVDTPSPAREADRVPRNQRAPPSLRPRAPPFR